MFSQRCGSEKFRAEFTPIDSAPLENRMSGMTGFLTPAWESYRGVTLDNLSSEPLFQRNQKSRPRSRPATSGTIPSFVQW